MWAVDDGSTQICIVGVWFMAVLLQEVNSEAPGLQRILGEIIVLQPTIV